MIMARFFTTAMLSPLLFWNCNAPLVSDLNILVEDGFIVEKLYTPSDEEQGSWVSITKDDKGRLITSDQYGALYYVEIPKIGSKAPIKVDSIPLNIGKAHGLLWAYNSLYVMVNSDKDDKES